MENPISYSDLFSPDIQQGIEGLVTQIQGVEKQLKGMLTSVKSEAQALGEALAGVSSATKGGRDTTKTDSAQVDKLYEAYNRLTTMYEHNSKVLKTLLDTERTQNERLAKSKTATDEYANALDRLKAQAELATAALAKMGANGNSAEIKRLETLVKGLEEQVKNLTKAQNANTSATNAATNSRKSSKVELLSVADAYKTLTPLIEKAGIDLNTLITTEKQHQQVSKNGQIANTALEGSYNQLYAQYNLIKTALNAMNKEMRDSESAGKVLEAEAARIMSVMKEMQAATGKYTLQVGDYAGGVEKALNGLNIATMQVMREMPTLANSAQQFFIAISNNVPIFVDNFKRAQLALGSFTKALGATLSAVFSWQTVLLVILTILPRVAKAIHDKKKATEEEAKAQKEANKENQKAVFILKDMQEMLLGIKKGAEESVVEIKFLNGVLADNTRSMQDRIDAGARLKQIFDEELSGFSAEEIAMGKAAEKMQNLTQMIYEQAEARRTLGQITELTNQLLDLQDQQTSLENYRGLSQEGKTLKELYDRYQELIASGRRDIHLDAYTQEYFDKYRKVLSDMAAVQAQIDYLAKNIKPVNLLDTSGTEKAKEDILEIPDVYNDMLQALINNMQDGIAKELAQYDLDYKMQREQRQEQMAKMQELLAKGNEEERKAIQEQMGWLSAQMVIEEDTYYKTRERMWQEHLKSFKLDIEEGDPEEETRKSIEIGLQVEQKLRDAASYKRYEEAVKADKRLLDQYDKDSAEYLSQVEANTAHERELREKLNSELTASNREYWETYLEELREAGVLTVDEYNKIMANLAKGTDAATATQGKRRRKRGGVRNLVELGFAANKVTGERDPDSGMLRIKDEYVDFANAVNEALETSMQYMDEWMDKRIEMAEVAVEAAQRETESAKTALDYEMQARANGYANNVELARKEYEEKLQMEREAIAERKRLEKIQEGINTAQQIGALVTATANLWSGYSKIPIAGPALAIAATALMWGSFFAAKIQAAQLANQTTYGKGMAEYVDYGGSHASHNDVDFGRDKNGKRRRVEKGEVIGVVRKDKVQKYGVGTVMNIINNLNNGSFEKNYVSSTELVNSVLGETPENRANSLFLSAKVEDMLRSAESRSMGLKTGDTGIFGAGQLEANYEMAFNGASADLSGIEQGLDTLIEQNKVRVVTTPWGRIEYNGNNKRIIRNG